jgi:hypothetical protein
MPPDQQVDAMLLSKKPYKDDYRMTTRNFHEPILIWLDREDPSKGTKRLTCVEDAIAALFRAEISAYSSGCDGLDHPVWATALGHLSMAKADGLGGSVHRAYKAMRELVEVVDILAE